jgi:hypothetical protein
MSATLTAPQVEYPVQLLKPVDRAMIRSQLDRDEAEQDELESLRETVGYRLPAEQLHRWKTLSLQEQLMQLGIPVLCPKSIEAYKASIADEFVGPAAELQETFYDKESALREAETLTRADNDLPINGLSLAMALVFGLCCLLVSSLFLQIGGVFASFAIGTVVAVVSLGFSRLGFFFTRGLAIQAIDKPREALRQQLFDAAAKTLVPVWEIASIPGYSAHSEIPISALRRAAEILEKFPNLEIQVDYLMWKPGVTISRNLWDFQAEPIIDLEPFLWARDKQTGARAAFAVWMEPGYEHEFAVSKSELDGNEVK